MQNLDQLIQQVKDHTILSLASDQISGTDTPVAIVPEGMEVRSLEKYMETRSSFRGELKTASLKDFAEYIGDATDTKVYVDAESMAAKAFFDLGTSENPGHGVHTANLSMKATSPYRAVRSLHGERHSQKNLAEWLEDWADFITITDSNGELMTVIQAIAAVRRLTITSKAESQHSEQHFGASRSAMEEIEAKAESALPAVIHFTCTPYEALGSRTFDVRLSIITSEDKPKLGTRIIQLEAQQESIANEFKETLADHLHDDIQVIVGMFRLL